MTTQCVEPGWAVEGKGEYLVNVQTFDELLFPHVDSCLAIAFVLADGRAVGGHVGMFMPGVDVPNAYGNAMDIYEQMKKLAGITTINKIILVGGVDWTNDITSGKNTVQSIIDAAKCPDTLYIDTQNIPHTHGVDVSLNPNRQMVFVTDRNPTGSIGVILFQLPYAKIKGKCSISPPTGKLSCQ